MNIDQRIEALTQSLELLAGMFRAKEERDERRFENSDAVAQSVEILAGMLRDKVQRDEARFEQIGHNFEIVLDSIKRLEDIAGAHEQRLDDLESQ